MGKNKMPIFSTQEQRNNLKFESDLGVEFVLDIEGYVFNLNAFQELKSPADKSKYLAVAANAIRDQLARTEVTSTCECVFEDLSPREKCEATQTKLKAPAVRSNILLNIIKSPEKFSF